MSVLAATTVAALLIANPSATEMDRIAANGGFLIGNAHRCGIEGERVVRAGQTVRELIVATARDTKEQEAGTGRFAAFFPMVSAFPDEAKEKLVASCQARRQRIQRIRAPRALRRDCGSASPRFRLGDGE